MGIYLTFWHCHPAGLAEEFISGPLEEFGKWFQQPRDEFPNDIEPSVLPLLAAVRAQGAEGLRATTPREAAAVDRLLDTYFGMFCDMARRDLKRSADPSLLPVRHFQGMFVEPKDGSADSSVSELWSFIFLGRGVGRDTSVLPYASQDGVYRLAYWTSEEVIRVDEAFAATPARDDVGSRAEMAARNAVTKARAQGTGLILEVA